MGSESFNDEFRRRTKSHAFNIIRLCGLVPGKTEYWIISKQLVRSATSVAANFRAACRARSAAEHFSKLCIVVEECDETLFWLELINDSNVVEKTVLDPLIAETISILQVLSKAKKSLKPKF
jgi:four helix bundle protein